MLRLVIAGFLTILLASPLASARTIRFIVPHSAAAGESADKELASVIESYNTSHARKHPAAIRPAVQLIRRGDNFSSLKELISLYLASDPPELAAVDSTELPALARTQLAKPIPAAIAQLTSGAKADSRQSLPFQRSVPVLVIDQEKLFRIRADREPLPRNWESLVKLASRISDADPQNPPLALPLQGPRGLWIFEAIAGKPLWTRETGGLKANRELDSSIQTLQRLLSPRSPALASSEMSWDRALQDFLDRRSPLLITTLDALPYIARKAPFRWKAGPLPSAKTQGARAYFMPGGTDLVVTRDSPEVWEFVRYLYSNEAASRWFASAGLLPLKTQWLATSGWKGATDAYRKVAESAYKAQPRDLRARSTDSDVVRAHSEWISALHHLFGETSRRLPTETVFTQLDATLAQ